MPASVRTRLAGTRSSRSPSGRPPTGAQGQRRAFVGSERAARPRVCDLALARHTRARRAFPVVWPLLYIGMGVSSFLVWKAKGARNASEQVLRAVRLTRGPHAAVTRRKPRAAANAGAALTLYGVQLALNLAWQPIMFKAGGWAPVPCVRACAGPRSHRACPTVGWPAAGAPH